MKKIFSILPLSLLALSAFAQHANELYNKGAVITVQSGAEIHVLGDVHMDGGDIANSGLIKLDGHWYNDNATSTQSGTGLVKFQNDKTNLTEDQQIRGTAALTGTAAFYDVDLNNTGTNKLVYLNGVNAEVKNTLEFVAAATNRLRTGTAANNDGSAYAQYVHVSNSATGAIVSAGAAGATTRYVEGRLRRTLAATTSYDLPIGANPAGTANGNQLAVVNFTTGGSGIIEASFTKDAGGSITASALKECEGTGSGTPRVDYKEAINHGYWNVDAVGAVTGTYTITLNPKNMAATPFGAAITDYGIIKRANAGVLSNYANTGGATCAISTSYSSGIARSGYSSFSDFTIGGGERVLPITLLTFAGKINGAQNDIYWTTATEQNSKTHVIERSADGTNDWTFVGSRQGAGNSNSPRNYTLPDEKPLARSYYRLRNIDFDGSEQLSNTILLERKRGGFGFAAVYPIPTEGSVTVEYELEEAGAIQLSVIDVLGRELSSERVSASKGLNNATINLADYADGTYMLMMTNGTHRDVTKIVKAK